MGKARDYDLELQNLEDLNISPIEKEDLKNKILKAKENSLYQKEWYKANKEKHLQNKKTNYKANKDKYLDYQKLYYSINRDEINNKNKEYYKENKEIILIKKKGKYYANR